jgi:hypothetical protein
LGVAGQVDAWSGSLVDPEALLLFSCTLGRQDARLFDAVVEWLQKNSRYVSVQRLKRMLKEETFFGVDVLRATAETIMTSADKAKWERVLKEAEKSRMNAEPLFFLRTGKPLPVSDREDPVFASYGLLRGPYKPRGVAQEFRPEPSVNILLRLRAMFGVNARCEALLFLLLNDCGTPRAMARDCYYSPPTVTKVLSEMSDSGYVVSRVQGRHRHYSLASDAWRHLLLGKDLQPSWVVWARAFSALEQVWTILNREDLMDRSLVEQASILRRMVKRSVAEQLERSGRPFVFGNDSAYPKEAFLPFFTERVEMFLDAID